MKKVYLLPNLFTTANLFCGVASIAFTAQGDYLRAAWILFAAMFFDVLDGLVARLTRSTSYFGEQYDSLSDVISFGVAPSWLIYSMALMDLGRMGVALIFVYIACSALRLARFNSQINTEEKKVFTGLPTPAAAGFLASTVILLTKYHLMEWIRFVPILMIVVGYLMVSRVRYPSIKGINLKVVKVRQPFLYLVGVILAICMAVFHTELFLFTGFSGYLILGLVGRVFERHHEKKAQKALAHKSA